ncbi:MAG: LysR substrate-binding domain-containing protein, partial [Pseudomonadota bacterium]
VLAEMAALETEFRALEDGKTGRLHIAIECHACFEWLLPVLEQFRRAWPEVDVDIRPGLAFDALPALTREDVDLVISSDPEDIEGVEFKPLFDYAPTFVVARENPLSQKPFVVAEDFRDQVLITYPVERSRLDIFSQLLIPAKVEPRSVRQVELTAVILMLVASDRGVAVLPDWVLRNLPPQSDTVAMPVTKAGLTRRLYAATRDGEAQLPFMAHLIRLARTEPLKLLHAG